MSAVKIGPHDPVLLSDKNWIWIECECGWISPSFFTTSAAENSHQKHVKREA